jgi:hypothetical protein
MRPDPWRGIIIIIIIIIIICPFMNRAVTVHHLNNHNPSDGKSKGEALAKENAWRGGKSPRILDLRTGGGKLWALRYGRLYTPTCRKLGWSQSLPGHSDRVRNPCHCRKAVPNRPACNRSLNWLRNPSLCYCNIQMLRFVIWVPCRSAGSERIMVRSCQCVRLAVRTVHLRNY